MREEEYKIIEVKITRRRDQVRYMCDEDAAGMVRMGFLNLPRTLTAREADVLQLRLRNRRLSELEPIVLEVLNVRVGPRFNFGDVTPRD